MRKKQWLVFLSVGLNLVLVLGIAYHIYQHGIPERGLRKLRNAPQSATWHGYVSQQNTLPMVTGKIVFFGNSITAGANWAELLNRPDVANRGIPGDDTEGMLLRLPLIATQKPACIVLMAGVNDFNLQKKEVEEVFSNYQQLIATCQKNAVPLIVCTTLYCRNNPWANQRIDDCNKLIIAYCKAHKVQVLDTNILLSDANQLGYQFTYDGIHLNGEGYQKWVVALLPLLKMCPQVAANTGT